MTNIIKCVHMRINCILVWPLLFLIDIPLTMTTDATWKANRFYANKKVKEAWYKYTLA